MDFGLVKLVVFLSVGTYFLGKKKVPEVAFEVGKVLGRAAQKLQQHRDNFSNLAGQNSFLRVMVPLNRIWTCLLTKRDPQNELVNDFSFVTFTPLIEAPVKPIARPMNPTLQANNYQNSTSQPNQHFPQNQSQFNQSYSHPENGNPEPYLDSKSNQNSTSQPNQYFPQNQSQFNQSDNSGINAQHNTKESTKSNFDIPFQNLHLEVIGASSRHSDALKVNSRTESLTGGADLICISIEERALMYEKK